MSQPVVFAAPADIELGPNPVNPDWIIGLSRSACGTTASWHKSVKPTLI
jgi:hypothetical protein